MSTKHTKQGNKPKISEAGKRFLKIRNRLRKLIPKDFTYIPRGETFCPVPLSKEDQEKALAAAKKYGII